MSWAAFLFVIFVNPWAVRMLSQNVLILALVVSATYFLFRLLFFKKGSLLLAILFCLTLFFQFSTTKRASLILLNNDQIRVRDMRLAEYPPIVIKIGSWSRWLPVANWFEGRSEFRALSRIGQNFAQAIDPNFYFFSNHPRERVGFQEIPLYPYILLPFFIWGALIFFEKAQRGMIFFVILLPLITLSIIGLNNLYGPFSLFPFISVATASGVIDIGKRLIKHGQEIKK